MLPHPRAHRGAGRQAWILRRGLAGVRCENDDVANVICPRIYSQFLALTTEVVLGPDEDLPRTSAVRCDFLTLMFKDRLTDFVATLSPQKVKDLNRALGAALDLPQTAAVVA